VIILVRSPCNKVGRVAHAVAVAVEAVVVGPDVAEQAGEGAAVVLPGYGRGGVPIIGPVRPCVVGIVQCVQVDGIAVAGGVEADAVQAVPGDGVGRDGVAIAGGR